MRGRHFSEARVATTVLLALRTGSVARYVPFGNVRFVLTEAALTSEKTPPAASGLSGGTFMKGNVHGQEQDPQEPEGSDLQIGPETHRRLSRRVDRLNRNPAVAVTQPWNWPTGVRSPRQPRQAPPRAFRRAVDSSYCLRERTGKTTVR